MFRMFHQRTGHYLVLVVIWGLCCLPNLGGPVLWDIDEGLNAEAAREMLASGNYVVPTFNYQLRSAKPVLLYWLQIGSYQLLGVNETAARLPSAVATLITILGVYELGRFLFGGGAGFLAGIVLATSISVLGAAHFANPDAVLLACITWTFGFWLRYWRSGAMGWLWLAAGATGLAVLAKGPVGFLLPAAIIFVFLLWEGELRRLLDVHLLEAVGIFLLVAAPWYIWVGVETKGVFLKEFWFKHHLNRVATPMENHSGSAWYYVVVLIIGFVPWINFSGSMICNTWGRLKEKSTDRDAVRFLVVWFAIFFVAFSLARTKLPNYILPLFPALALLMGLTLERWRAGQLRVPGWMMGVSLGCLGLTGILATVLLLIGSGVIWLPSLAGLHFPELARWAWLGLPLACAAGVAFRLLLIERRDAALTAVIVGSVSFVACIAGGTIQATNDRKSTRMLAEALPWDQEFHEVRLGAYRYDRPSLVFYCRREVRRLEREGDALEFLSGALPSYLFLQESRWKELQAKAPAGVRLVARFPDLYSISQPVVLVSNQPGEELRLLAQERSR